MPRFTLTSKSDQLIDLEKIIHYLESFSLLDSIVEQFPDQSWRIEITIPRKKLKEFLSDPFLKVATCIEPAFSKEIDWKEQARLHCMCDQDSCIVIDLSAYGQTESSFPLSFRLVPGPAFGDASHDTTRLMLSMLSKYVKNRYVVDIGTGSGILCIAAHLLGARSCLGVDIDLQSIQLARQNLILNHVPSSVWVGTDKDFIKVFHDLKSKDRAVNIMLMNMTFQEQEAALAAYRDLLQCFEYALVSGILKEQKDLVIKARAKLGWKLVEEYNEGQWLGLIFKCNLTE